MAHTPEHIVTSNPHGCIIFGPTGTKSDGSELNIATAKGHHDHYNKNGNKTSITPKKSEEYCGREFVEDRKDGENENIAKAIICENGDMLINCQKGNLKIIAKNIYIETIGDDTDGNFMLSANEAITMTAGEQMTLGGAKVCITSSDSINLTAQGLFNLTCTDINKVSPLNPIIEALLPGPIKELITGVSQSCR